MKKLLIIAISIILIPNFNGISGGKNIHIVDCGKYLKVVDNSSYLYNPGYPLLPYKVRNYIFGANVFIKNVSIRVKNIQKIKIYKNIEAAPPAVAIGGMKWKESRDYKIYPSKWFDYKIRRGIWHGKPAIFLSIYLFPYRYKKGGVLLHADFDINVDYGYNRSVSKKSDEYDLLIITPSRFYGEIKRLADFKESHGIKTKIEMVEDISRKWKGDEAEKIKYAIKDAIEQYGIKYVLLVGDADVIPVRYVKLAIQGMDKVPSDLYYADIYKADGSFSSWDDNRNGIYGERDDDADLMPDVYIGRLPASNENDVKILVDKIIHFSTPPQKAVFIGTELFTDSEIREGEYLKDYIATYLPNMKMIKLYEINGTANSVEIAREINRGALFVNFASHGSPTAIVWGTGSWSVSDLSMLHNGYRLPVVFAMSCLTNDFDEADCLGEQFLLKQGGGAIAYAGSSRIAYVYLGNAIKNGLSGYLDFAFFKAYYDGFDSVGSIFSGAKEYYLMHFSLMSELDRLTVMEYNLLGDPTIVIPPLPETSRAYVNTKICNGSINVYSIANAYNGTAKLYYKNKGSRNWIYYGESSKPYHWNFIPPAPGIYELCSIVDDEQFPLFGDCYCIFDDKPPILQINEPETGGIYIFNNKVATTSLNLTISIGKIDIQGKATDEFFDKVEIMVNGNVEYVTTSKNFKWEWNGVHFGFYEVEINAYDLARNKASHRIGIVRIS